MRSILEKALIALLNEEKDKADALFHDFILERSRQIHESLRQGEDFVLDESWEQELSIDEMFSEADLADDEVVEAKTSAHAELTSVLKYPEYFGLDEGEKVTYAVKGNRLLVILNDRVVCTLSEEDIKELESKLEDALSAFGIAVSGYDVNRNQIGFDITGNVSALSEAVAEADEVVEAAASAHAAITSVLKYPEYFGLNEGEQVTYMAKGNRLVVVLNERDIVAVHDEDIRELESNLSDALAPFGITVSGYDVNRNQIGFDITGNVSALAEAVAEAEVGAEDEVEVSAEEEQPIEDRVSDLEAELQRLAAEFDAAIGGDDDEAGLVADEPVADEAEEEEQFESLEEGVVDTLTPVTVKTGEGQVADGKVAVNTVSPALSLPVDARQAGKPVEIKSEERNGFDLEQAPKSATLPAGRNTMKKAGETQTSVKKEGDKSAVLNQGGDDKAAQHSLFDKQAK
jgi:hypothetical protein